MENQQLTSAWTSSRTSGQTTSIKDSIRDMIRLQQERQIPDELFWEIFNARVLLNEQIDVNDFFDSRNTSRIQA